MINLLALINGNKTYAATILAVVSGLGMVLTRNDSGGVPEIFQALMLIFGGAGVAGLRHAVSMVPSEVLEAAGRHD